MKRYIPILAVLAGVALGICLPFLVRVKVDCKTQYGGCSEEVTSALKKNDGKSLFSAKKEIRKELKKNITVSEFSMQFRLPSVLVVYLIIKNPTFALRSTASGVTALVDTEGKVLLVAANPGFPELEFSSDIPAVGSQIPDKIFFALRLVKGTGQMYQLNKGRISGESLVVELPSGIRVIFPLQGDVEVLLGSLRLIHTKIQSGDQAQKYSEVDLRFKNPVLR